MPTMCNPYKLFGDKRLILIQKALLVYIDSIDDENEDDAARDEAEEVWYAMSPEAMDLVNQWVKNAKKD